MLTRLPPPPDPSTSPELLSKDEIAGLFDTVEEYLGNTEHWELADDSTPDPTDAADSLHKLRATLHALAQENERLKLLAKCDGCGKPFDENGGICEPCHSAAISGHIRPLGQRIRELEAERDQSKG